METDIYMTADRFPLVRDIGTNRIEGSYTHPDRIQDFDVFLFVTKGEMQVIEEGTPYVVKENEHLFLKKGLHHWGLLWNSEETVWYWIHFDPMIDDDAAYKEHIRWPEMDYFSPGDYQYRFRLPKYGRPPFHDTIEQRLRLLLEEYGQKKEHRMSRISVQAYLLFMDLHRFAMRPSEEGPASRSNAIVNDVMRYLESHADQDFDSRDLSRHLNLNYSYISSTFKKQTGQNIIETHTKLRINQAIDLMKNSPLNISEISDRLGYPNAYYFSRVFKKTLGKSPSDYRKQIY